VDLPIGGALDAHEDLVGPVHGKFYGDFGILDDSILSARRVCGEHQHQQQQQQQQQQT
jgi:hypothetical protein